MYKPHQLHGIKETQLLTHVVIMAQPYIMQHLSVNVYRATCFIDYKETLTCIV